MLLQLFGTFTAQVDGRLLPSGRSRKVNWLLALLALQRGREMDRASLACLLWPDSAYTQALYNLRRTLTELREVLGSEAWRLSSPHAHTLAVDLTGAQVDVLAFDAALARGDEASLQSAVELYHGPLLGECTEPWILQERLPREQACLEALETLAGHAMARGDPAAALGWLRRAVALDPLRETAQQALLKALVARGDLTAFLLAYRDFCLQLHQEIGADPSPETKALFHQLRAQARRRDGVAERRAPEAVALPSSPRRLPRPLSQFVGRETALHAVEACLADARLVTLTGPGGVGKTRLAIQVADTTAEDHPDGVWFVDLSRLSEPGLVPQEVASVLGVQGQADRPLTETLAERLRSRHLLLVLDNCEHLLSACAELVEALLSSGPDLRVLATSRQTLGLPGEVAWQLPGLQVPPPRLETADAVPESLLQFEAVRLFVERGRRATSAFSLTGRNAWSVAEVCRRLDGMPLAIELAAARLNALSVEEIAARLDDRFHLLTSGSRTALPRQQTLRATMDWSYELLSPQERILLRRLSVFAGSFSLNAVESVCTDPEVGEETHDAEAPASPITLEVMLDLLTRLVDRSLVVVERSDETGTRYRLLETIRQYALERLRAGTAQCAECEEVAVRRRHQEFYLWLAEDADPHLVGPDQAAWLERLQIELDSFRSAWRWTLERRESEAAVRLAGALWRFMYMRGHMTEGRQWLERALSMSVGTATRARAKALHGAAVLWHEQDQLAAAHAFEEESLAFWRQVGDQPAIAESLDQLGHITNAQGDRAQAVALFEESLALRRQLGDKAGTAASLNALGWMAKFHGDYERAAALCGESLSLRHELGDRWGIAYSLEFLTEVATEQGDDEQAEKLARESFTLRQQLGDRRGMAATLVNLGRIASNQGDPEAAFAYYEQSLGIWRELGIALGLARCLAQMGNVACVHGDYERAAGLFQESLVLSQPIADVPHMASCVEGLARVAANRGQSQRAARLFGAAQATRGAFGIHQPPVRRAAYEQNLALVRTALGEEAFAAAWAEGQKLTLDQAVSEALQA